LELKGVLILGAIGTAIVFFLVVAAKGRRIREAGRRPEATTQARTAITRAQQMVADFGKFIERSPLGPTDIADEKRLPHPKETLLTAILLLIRVAQDPAQRGLLEVAALELAQYQPAVGPSPLRQINLAALAEATDDPSQMARTLLEGVDPERWEQFNKRAEEERLTILRAIQGARPVAEVVQ
jgi:hypothetical protein